MPRKDQGKPVAGQPYIKKTKAGKFIVDIYLRHPETGKRERRIRRTCGNLASAVELRDQLTAQNTLNQLPVRESEKITIHEIIQLKQFSIRENASYADSVRIFNRIREYFGPTRTLESIDEEAIASYVAYLRKCPVKKYPHKTLSSKTVFHYLQHLLSLLRLAKRKRWIEFIPEYRFKKQFGKRKMTVTLESFLKVMQYLPESPHPDRGMMYMALFTGQRLGDLRHMTWDQIEDGSIHYRSSKTNHDGLAIHTIPVDLMEELRKLRQVKQSNYLFANPKTGKPYSPNAVRRHIKKACDQAGVPHFTPHQIRHLATSVGLSLTGDVDLVQKWVGWLSPELIRTTYGHLMNRTDKLMDAMDHEIQTLKKQLGDVPTAENVISLAAFRKQKTTHEEDVKKKAQVGVTPRVTPHDASLLI